MLLLTSSWKSDQMKSSQIRSSAMMSLWSVLSGMGAVEKNSLSRIWGSITFEKVYRAGLPADWSSSSAREGYLRHISYRSVSVSR